MIRPAIHKIVSSEQGLSYLPVLMSKLRALEATTTGVVNQSYRFSCGVRGRIFSSPTFRKIEIWQDPPAFMSGLVHWGMLVDKVFMGVPPERYTMDGPQNILRLKPGEGEPTREGEDVGTYLQGFFQAQPEITQAVSATRNWQGVRELAVLPYSWDRYYGDLRPSQCSTIKSGNYTGVMRKVVQLLLGTSTKILYRSFWLTSHGVFISNSGSKWLIEIGTRGVLAMRIQACPVSVTMNRRLHEQLGWMPSGEFFPEDIDAAILDGTVRRLLPESAMTSFYAKQMHFGSMGFAYSYSGREAQVTSWTAPMIGNIRYTMSHRHKMTIQCDVDDSPITATLAEVDSGYLYCPALNVFPHPKFPGLMGLQSQDIRAFIVQPTGDMLPTSNYPVVCDRSPVFVFYEDVAGPDSAAERLVTYTYIEDALEPDGNFDTLYQSSLPKYYDDYNREINQHGPGQKRIRCGFGTKESSPGYTWSTLVQSRTHTLHADRGGQVLGVDGNDDYYLAQISGVHVTVDAFRARSWLHNESLIVTPGDREAYYHLVGDNRSESARAVENFVTGVVTSYRPGHRKIVDYVYHWGPEGTALPLLPRKDGPYIETRGQPTAPIGDPSWVGSTYSTPIYDPFFDQMPYNWISYGEATTEQTYSLVAFIAGAVRELPFENRLKLVNWNQTWFQRFDQDKSMYIYASAFTDHPQWIATLEFNSFPGKTCHFRGNYPYDHPEFNASNVTYVGLS